MKTTILRALSLTAVLLSPLAIAVGCAENGKVGTSHEISHSESDKKGWFGGQYHEANTTYRNSDGSTSVEKETTSDKNGTTTIVRVRTTTNVDGTVSTQSEKRVIVQGSDHATSETKNTN